MSKNIIDYPITTHFGEKDWFHSTPHSGIDLATPVGTKIFSQDSGQIHITVDKWLGNTVRLKLDNGDVIVYGHLSQINVSEGQYVAPSTLLGLTGGAVGSKNSGRTTGAHVHISEYVDGKLVDPTNYLFHHQTQNSNPFVIPVMIILILIAMWKFKKFVLYGVGIITLLTVIFLVS